MSYDVKLKDVARLSDHTHFEIPRQQLGARRGPFPYYGDLFERFETDDFGLNEPSVIFMAAAGKVVESCGFRVAMEHGRCGSNAFAHVLVAHDPADAEYIHACLAHHPHALDYIGGANQLQTLDELAVLRIALPWPSRAVREAFVRRIADADKACQAAREARARAVEVGASNDEVLALESALYEKTQTRDILINDFMEFGVLGDLDCSPVSLPSRSVPAPYSDARAERARAELADKAGEEARQQGGVPFDPCLADALGPLLPIVAHDAAGLDAQDVAWELAPFAVMRACASHAQWERVMAASNSHEELVCALDALMAELAASNSLLNLLPNLSYESSVLDFVRLQRWCASLVAIDPARIGPGHIRAACDLSLGAPAVPREVESLVAAVAGTKLAECSCAGEAGFYLANAQADCLSDIPALVDARLGCLCQCADTQSLLQACLVRAVAARDVPDESDFAGLARADSALLDDCFPGRTAAIAMCEVCDPFSAWADKPPRRDDPRWSHGVPTRMRSTFAWLQHCLSHVEPGGISINLIPTSELHTFKPVDCEILLRLACEGHVRAVVTLPSRIWGDGRPPMSLVVLQPEAGEEPCLMADASCLGEERCDLAALQPNPQRRLPADVLERLSSLLTTWVAQGRLVDGAGVLAHVVTTADMAQAGGSISPWTYLGATNPQSTC